MANINLERKEFVRIFNTQISCPNINSSVYIFYGQGGSGKSHLCKYFERLVSKNKKHISTSISISENRPIEYLLSDIRLSYKSKGKINFEIFDLVFSHYLLKRYSFINATLDNKDREAIYSSAFDLSLSNADDVLENATEFVSDTAELLEHFSGVGAAAIKFARFGYSLKKKKELIKKNPSISQYLDMTPSDLEEVLVTLLSEDINAHIKKNDVLRNFVFIDQYENNFKTGFYPQGREDELVKKLCASLINTSSIIFSRTRPKLNDFAPLICNLIAVSEFTKIEARELLDENEINRKEIRESILSDNLLPYLVQSKIDIYKEVSKSRTCKSSDLIGGIERITERMLNTRSMSEIKLIDSLFLLDEFTLGFAKIIANALTLPINTIAIKQMLMSTPFVEIRNGVYILHDVFREFMQQKFDKLPIIELRNLWLSIQTAYKYTTIPESVPDIYLDSKCLESINNKCIRNISWPILDNNKECVDFLLEKLQYSAYEANVSGRNDESLLLLRDLVTCKYNDFVFDEALTRKMTLCMIIYAQSSLEQYNIRNIKIVERRLSEHSALLGKLSINSIEIDLLIEVLKGYSLIFNVRMRGKINWYKRSLFLLLEQVQLLLDFDIYNKDNIITKIKRKLIFESINVLSEPSHKHLLKSRIEDLEHIIKLNSDSSRISVSGKIHNESDIILYCENSLNSIRNSFDEGKVKVCLSYLNDLIEKDPNNVKALSLWVITSIEASQFIYKNGNISQASIPIEKCTSELENRYINHPKISLSIVHLSIMLSVEKGKVTDSPIDINYICSKVILFLSHSSQVALLDLVNLKRELSNFLNIYKGDTSPLVEIVQSMDFSNNNLLSSELTSVKKMVYSFSYKNSNSENRRLMFERYREISLKQIELLEKYNHHDLEGLEIKLLVDIHKYEVNNAKLDVNYNINNIIDSHKNMVRYLVNNESIYGNIALEHAEDWLEQCEEPFKIRKSFRLFNYLFSTYRQYFPERMYRLCKVVTKVSDKDFLTLSNELQMLIKEYKYSGCKYMFEENEDAALKLHTLGMPSISNDFDASLRISMDAVLQHDSILDYNSHLKAALRDCYLKSLKEKFQSINKSVIMKKKLRPTDIISEDHDLYTELKCLAMNSWSELFLFRAFDTLAAFSYKQYVPGMLVVGSCSRFECKITDSNNGFYTIVNNVKHYVPGDLICKIGTNEHPVDLLLISSRLHKSVVRNVGYVDADKNSNNSISFPPPKNLGNLIDDQRMVMNNRYFHTVTTNTMFSTKKCDSQSFLTCRGYIYVLNVLRLFLPTKSMKSIKREDIVIGGNSTFVLIRVPSDTYSNFLDHDGFLHTLFKYVTGLSRVRIVSYDDISSYSESDVISIVATMDYGLRVREYHPFDRLIITKYNLDLKDKKIKTCFSILKKWFHNLDIHMMSDSEYFGFDEPLARIESKNLLDFY